jgi:hypothetical protein
MALTDSMALTESVGPTEEKKKIRRLIEGSAADWQTIAALRRVNVLATLKPKQKLWLLQTGEFVVDDTWFLTSVRRKWGGQNREDILGKIALDVSLLTLTFNSFNHEDKVLLIDGITKALPGFKILEEVYPSYASEIQSLTQVLSDLK